LALDFEEIFLHLTFFFFPPTTFHGSAVVCTSPRERVFLCKISGDCGEFCELFAAEFIPILEAVCHYFKLTSGCPGLGRASCYLLITLCHAI